MASKMTGLGMALQEPKTLLPPIILGDSEEGNSFTLTTLNTGDDVYKEVCIDFVNADMTVVKIERLVNPHLWNRFNTERRLMIEQRTNIDPDFKLNEKYLYHGTSVLKQSICEEGLDSRMSKQGCFGRGIYFSDYPRKCVKYAEHGDNGVSFVLLARVILGTPKVFAKGQKDRTLVREPEKTAPYKGYRFYDSVEGCPTNHREYVVYESRRALVECIITYSKKDIVKTLPVTLEATTVKRQEDFDDIESDFSDSDNDTRPVRKNVDDKKSSSSDESDSDTANGAAGNRKKIHSDSAEDLLRRKREEFQRKTGVTDEYMVDHYLLKANMNVSQAVKLFKERPKEDVLSDEEDSPVKSKLELEIEEAAKKPEHPTPGSQEWNSLSEDLREAVINSLVEDFLIVTGLTDDDGFARRCLATVNYNLDLAVLAYYEEM